MRRSLLLLPLLLLAPLASGGVINGNPTNGLRSQWVQSTRPWAQVRPWFTWGASPGLHAAIGPGVGLPCLTVSAGDASLLAMGGCTPAR